MREMLVLLSAAMALSPYQGPPGGADAGKLITLDRDVQQAMVRGNVSFLSRALARDFKFTHADGFVQTKSDVIRLARRTPRYYLRRDVIDPTVELHGSVALVLGNLDVASGPEAKESGNQAYCYSLDYVHLFSRRAGQWQLLSHRTTKMTKSPVPCPNAP